MAYSVRLVMALSVCCAVSGCSLLFSASPDDIGVNDANHPDAHRNADASTLAADGATDSGDATAQCTGETRTFDQPGDDLLVLTEGDVGCRLRITIRGAVGGNGIAGAQGGSGGAAQFVFLPMTAGTFEILIGEGGVTETLGSGGTTRIGGGAAGDADQGGTGGGASAVVFNSVVLAISGGGGGGGGVETDRHGGAGGSLNSPGAAGLAYCAGCEGLGGGNNIGGSGCTEATSTCGDGGSAGLVGEDGSPGDGGPGYPNFRVAGGGAADSTSGAGGGGGYGGGGGSAIRSGAGGGGAYLNESIDGDDAVALPPTLPEGNGSITIEWL